MRKTISFISFLIFFFARIATVSFISVNVNAYTGHLDYKAAVNARTTPYGASAEGTAGYLIPIWGLAPSALPSQINSQEQTSSQAHSNENPFWGYIRPSATVRGPATPALVSALDFYPVTFFGFSGGRTFSRQLTEQPGVDCDVAECELEINSWYWNVKLMGRYERLSGFLHYERIEYDDHDHLHKPIGEGGNVVFLSPQNETGFLRTAVLNYQILDEISGGFVAQDFKADISEERMNNQFLFSRYTRDAWIYTLGFGRFDSTQNGVAAQAILSIGWIGKAKLAP